MKDNEFYWKNDVFDFKKKKLVYFPKKKNKTFRVSRKSLPPRRPRTVRHMVFFFKVFFKNHLLKPEISLKKGRKHLKL